MTSEVEARVPDSSTLFTITTPGKVSMLRGSPVRSSRPGVVSFARAPTMMIPCRSASTYPA